MKKLATIAASLALVAAVAPAAAQACPNQNASPSELTVRAARQSIVCLINRTRSKSRAGKLRGDNRLVRAAQRHSNSMDAANYFSHNGPSGTPTSRIQRAGYLAGARSWGIAENLRWGSGGQGTPRTAVAQWMASPPHRAAMLSRSYRQLGVGIAIGSPSSDAGADTAIYTVDFGYRH